MASELQLSFRSGATVYFLIRNRAGQIWNGGSFEAYATANYSTYDVAASEQGTASSYYVADFPTLITTPGVYSVVAKQQIGGSPAETDPTIGSEDIDWGGSSAIGIHDIPNSGHIGNFLPMRLFRGQMIRNFQFKLVSASDHVTSFTSGVLSGQICRDGGLFGALQSGAFTELGLGHYALQALTSGDLNCNTASLVITGQRISGGGACDQRDFTFILNRVSGQAG